MVNYQLYRTNVLLGGQMKWDLVLDDVNDQLVIKDFHLTPISRNVPFNKRSDETLINYSHQENVKRYYHDISDSFFLEYGNPELHSPYPLISNTEKDTHDDTFEMGCRRMSYRLYEKQFNFFCPIWLEELKHTQYLCFEFLFSSASDPSNVIFRREFDMDYNNLSGYHDKFITYFNNYLNDCGISSGNSDLIYINLDDNYSNISGLNVKTGIINSCKLNIVDNILESERPLLEVDDMIIKSFPENKIISRQLFNLNFCFNPDEILFDYISDMIGRDGVVISIDVKIKDKENNTEQKLELVDFYSNYEYIPRKFCGPVKTILYEPIDPNDIDSYYHFVEKDIYESCKGDNRLNVLSYLKDHRCIDLVGKNKIIQSVIHWSLTDSNDYIFNVYPGFAGFRIETNDSEKITNIYSSSSRYDDTPDISLQNYSINGYNTGWCNMLDISHIMERKTLVKYLSDLLVNDSIYLTKFKPGIRAKHILCPEADTDYEFNVLMLYGGNLYNKGVKDHDIIFKSILKLIPENESTQIYYNNGDSQFSGFDKNLVIIKNSENLYIYSNNIESLTHYNIIQNLRWLGRYIKRRNQSCDNMANILEKMISSFSHITACDKTLDIGAVEGPSLSINEVQYYKSNDRGQVLFREYGSIRPTFIKTNNDINFNYVYSKKILKENNHHEYTKLIKTNFGPVYPSIGYFPFKKNEQQYNTLKDIDASYPEYNSFNVNKIINLFANIECKLESVVENGIYLSTNELVKRYLKEFYNVGDDEILLNYIDNLYEHECSFEYKCDKDGYPMRHNNNSNMFVYIYTTKIRLK